MARRGPPGIASLILRVEVDGESYELELGRNGSESTYSLKGAEEAHGSASVVELTPGTFSVLMAHRSFTVSVSERDGWLEVWTGAQRYMLSISDPRDRPAQSKKLPSSGPVEIRAQMPGRIIKLLVTVGDAVETGQGIIVVEAMKMQNEMKSPKDGVVSLIRAQEGATVAAGETMMVIE